MKRELAVSVAERFALGRGVDCDRMCGVVRIHLAELARAASAASENDEDPALRFQDHSASW